MKYKNIFICSAVLLQAFPAWGQTDETWSLQDCINHALTHNIRLKQSQLTEQLGEAELEQKRAALFPSLSFSTTQSLNYRPLQKSASNIVANGIANSSTNKLTENGSYGLNASWTVWDGGANRSNIKAQKVQNDINKLNTQQTANSIQEQIAQLYVQILYTKDALEVNRAMQETAQRQYSRGAELYEQGLLSKADLAQLEAQAASAQYDCVATQTQMANYTRQLKELLEITDTRAFDIAGIDSPDEAVLYPLPAIEDAYRNALACRPEIQSSRLNLEAADLNVDIARAGYFPSVSLSAGVGDSHYSGSNDSAGEQMRQNLNASAGVTLSVPIFDNKRNKTNLNRAKLSRLDSELEFRNQQKQLYSTVEEHWLNASSNQQKYIAAESKLKSAQSSYELLDEQFRNGLKNIVELLNGRDQLLNAQQDRLQSKYNALLSIQLLNFYQGYPIQL